MKITDRFRAALAAFRSGASDPGGAVLPSEDLEDRSAESMLVRLSDPDTWLTDLLGGGRAAGVHVNRDTALGLPAFWRAVNLIAGDVAKLPLRVLRRLDGGGREPDRYHPAQYLLKRRPNPQTSSFAWRMRMQGDALSSGNGYSWIERIADRPVALWPLPPEYVEVESTSLGRWQYWLDVPGQRRAKIPAADMIHIRGLERSDSIAGISVVDRLKAVVGGGLAEIEYGAGFFERGARPTATVKAPPGQKIPEQELQRMERSLAEIASGVSKMHRIPVLPRGLELVPWSMSNSDAEYLGSREFRLIDIALAFGVPPHKLGHTARTSFASLEEENRSYLDESLDQHLCAWEAELDLKLLTEKQNRRDTHSVKFKRQALVRANMATRQGFYSSALTLGWMSRDEVRELEDLNPIPNGEGKVFLRPLNQGAATDSGGSDAPENAPEGAQEDGEDAPTETPKATPEARSLALERLGATLERLERRCEKQSEAARTKRANLDYLREQLEGDIRLWLTLEGAEARTLLRVPDAAELAAGALAGGAGARGARELLATVEPIGE